VWKMNDSSKIFSKTWLDGIILWPPKTKRLFLKTVPEEQTLGWGISPLAGIKKKFPRPIHTLRDVVAIFRRQTKLGKVSHGQKINDILNNLRWKRKYHTIIVPYEAIYPEITSVAAFLLPLPYCFRRCSGKYGRQKVPVLGQGMGSMPSTAPQRHATFCSIRCEI
jgi:hypothetical protein